jgi:uncharacterized protein DUF3443
VRAAVRNILLFALSPILLLAAGCGGGSSSPGSNNNPIPTSGQNVQSIAVNSGPLNNYANGVFTSVTVCVPGSSNCQTINDVLVDTGSSGLRLLSSALTLSLPQQTASGGSPVVECFQFLDGVTWGPVRAADIKLAGEQASSVPIQVIGDPGFPTVPSSCTSAGAPEDTLQKLLANGILGISPFRQDCGPACAISGSGNPGLYYICPASGCTQTQEGLAQQLQNPVWMFSQDNNGLVVALPSVPATGAPSLSGSLIFGVSTQSNNALGSAKVFTLDANGNITTSFRGQSYTNSFIDTGSNGIFFLTSTITGIPTCPSPNSGFYCPSSTQNLSATQIGANGTSANVSFSVANADTLFATPNFAFNDLAGTNAGVFDWGLPFFFGHDVFMGIEGQSSPAGLGPFWAY